MKARPRNAENRIGQELNHWFERWGFSPIERKPIIGRTGPDYTMNDLEMVLDAKSRLQVPGVWKNKSAEMVLIDDTLIGIRLCRLDNVLDQVSLIHNHGPSKMIRDYYEHMREWQRNNVPNGITGVILHKPGMNYKDAMLVISLSDRSVMYGRIINRQRARSEEERNLRQDRGNRQGEHEGGDDQRGVYHTSEDGNPQVPHAQPDGRLRLAAPHGEG